MDEVDREVARWRYKRQLSPTTPRPTTRGTAPPPAYMIDPIANDKPQSDIAAGETVRRRLYEAAKANLQMENRFSTSWAASKFQFLDTQKFMYIHK